MSYVDKDKGLQYFIYDTAVDMTGGTGDIIVLPIPEPASGKIQVIKMGYQLRAATSAAVTMTTAAELVLDHRTTGAATSTELGSMTLPVSTAAYLNEIEDLNATSTTENLYTEPDYPEIDLSAGEYLVFARDTQGVGGTQSIMPWIEYRIVE